MVCTRAFADLRASDLYCSAQRPLKTSEASPSCSLASASTHLWLRVKLKGFFQSHFKDPILVIEGTGIFSPHQIRTVTTIL
jgi:hypothetical protein